MPAISTADWFASVLSSLGPIGTGLAVGSVPAIAGISAYLTTISFQSKVDRLEGELSRLKAKAEDDASAAESKYAELDARYQSIRKSSALIQLQLDAIASEAEDVANRLDASDYSVLVAAPTSIPGDTPDELVFLCASGPQYAQLKWIRVPIASSMSGEVYRSGNVSIASPPGGGTAFAARTDEITSFKTKETLSVCLRHRANRVGVAQFVNKRTGRFEPGDADRAPLLCSALAVRVGDFVADPRRVIDMGHAPRNNKYQATVMCFDLTNFAALFSQLDNSVIADLLNQYFQELCGIATRYGGTIDQVMGDGALLIFNLDQTLDDHVFRAATASTKMLEAFRDLRDRWTTLGYDGAENLRVRFAMSCGAVTRAEVGPSQSRRSTVIGPAVNDAAHVCSDAPRDRDVICLTKAVCDVLPPPFKAGGSPLVTARVKAFELVQ